MSVMKNTTQDSTPPVISIRLEHSGEVAAIRRIAALDSSPVPASPVLIGMIDGEPAAAMSLSSGRVVADPFQPTAALVALLRLRADHLHGPARGPDRRSNLAHLAVALRGRREAA
jgi:hypothetical protein